MTCGLLTLLSPDLSHLHGGCSDSDAISSIRVGTGESCAFYDGENCSGDTKIVNRVNDCVAFSGRNQARSYKCVSVSSEGFTSKLREAVR